MAKAKAEKPAESGRKPDLSALAGLDGLEIISTDKVWVRPYPDCVVRGIYIGHEVREDDDGKPRTDAQVRLTYPCHWETEDGEHLAVPGDVVTVTISATLRKIPELPIGSEVVIKWGEKVDIGRGQTVWRTTVWAGAPPAGYRSAIDSPRALARTRPMTPDRRREDDDVPF